MNNEKEINESVDGVTENVNDVLSVLALLEINNSPPEASQTSKWPIPHALWGTNIPLTSLLTLQYFLLTPSGDMLTDGLI